MICYHHTDLDGLSAAYAVHNYKPVNVEDFASSYVPFNYAEEFPMKHTLKDDVFIVDLSFKNSDYDKLIEICNTARTVTWIDHHSSSLDVVKEHEKELQAISNLTYFISDKACGALLTYVYLNTPFEKLKEVRKLEDPDNVYSFSLKLDGENAQITGVQVDPKTKTNSKWNTHFVKIPKWLFHVDDYDCWKKQDPNSDLFKLGVMSKSRSFITRNPHTGDLAFDIFWNSRNIEEYTDLHIGAGRNIFNHLQTEYNSELNDTFEWEYNGTKLICKDGRGDSHNFGKLVEKYPAAILFHYSGKDGKWKYSVYSPDNSTFNCKEFCEKFGGGGHDHAAGFKTDKLIFLHPSHNEEKEDVIFLGGTCGDSDWRSEFMAQWKKTTDSKVSTKLFNPVVEEWTEECIKKENEVKSKAALNLFVITPEFKGPYSFAEAVECSHSSKVFFAIYDKDKQFDSAFVKSTDAIGKIIENHGGVYKKYIDTSIEELVKDVVAAL